MSQEVMDMIQTGTLVLTFTVIIWYTVETSKLRRVAQKQVDIAQKQVLETQRQIEVQKRPFVIFDINRGFDSGTHRGTYDVGVKNIGNGTALNIKVRDVDIPQKEEHIKKIVFRFPDPIPILCTGERASIKYETKIIDEWVSNFPPTGLYYPHVDASTSVTIEFSNVDGQRYFVEVKIVPKKLESITSGKLPLS